MNADALCDGVLNVVYARRHNMAWSFTTLRSIVPGGTSGADFACYANACDQLAAQGLIVWKPILGPKGMTVDGIAKITTEGINVLEARAPQPGSDDN